jgi:hypothetical protein
LFIYDKKSKKLPFSTIIALVNELMTPISIVIITLNEAERIGNILRDLAQQSYQNFEVIVVGGVGD